LTLTPEQRAELDSTLARLMDSQRRSAALFVAEDLPVARQLAGEKDWFRQLEARAAAQHMEQIKAGRTDVLDAGALYLEILRDLKAINSHIVGAAAYPILARHGELLPNRLRDAQG